MRERTYNINNITHGIISIAIMVILYLLVRRLSGVLLPFLLSWVAAYLLHPLVGFLQYKCRLKNRGLSVLLAMLLVLVLLSGVIALIVPWAAREMGALSGYIAEYINSFDSHSFLPERWQEQYEAMLSSLSIDNVLSNEYVLSIMKKVAPTLWSVVSGSMGVLSGMAVVFVCLLYVFFILMDYEKMQGWSNYVPQKYRAAVKMIMSDLELNMNRYFRGQALVASIVGVLFAIGFEIIGLPMGIVIGLLIGLLNMVPYLQIAGIIPCVLLGILQSAETGRPIWVVFLCIALVFVVVQVIQDMVLTPKIMGNVTGMNPAVILLALSVWGSLLGVVGMIIALPVTTIIISYYKRFVIGDESILAADKMETEEKTTELKEEVSAMVAPDSVPAAPVSNEKTSVQ